MSSGYQRVTNELDVRYIDTEPAKRPTAVQRTEAAIREQWQGDNGRINQARAFIKRAKKSDAKRKREKASRKRNRK
jgi:hypothetical protein